MKENNVTPQLVWNSLLKTEQMINKMSAEADKRAKDTKEQFKSLGAFINTLSVEADKRAKEADKRFKKLEDLFTGQWGKLMEALVEGDFVKLMRQRGIDIIRISEGNKGTYEGQHYEFDIVGVNGDVTVACEVKTTLHLRDVEHFLKKIKNLSLWMKEHEGKKIYGAVAYLKANQGAEVYAGRQGFFVIRTTGSSASIINKKSFKPKVF